MSFVNLICPRGWQIDHTEHACCERRRYDDAMEAVLRGKRPRRMRDQNNVDFRQAIRCTRLQAVWRALGFSTMPSAAKALLDSCALLDKICKA